MLKKTMVSSVSLLVVFVAVAAGTVAWASSDRRAAVKTAGLWYEDNNMGSAGGAPPDFYSTFMQPGTWADARKAIDVYYVRTSVLEARSTDDAFLQKYFLPVLAKSHIKLALDTGSATWLNADPSAKTGTVKRDVDLIERIQRLGGKVDDIGLQSTLSKPLVVQGRKTDYPMATRIKDAVDYATVIKKSFPDIKIGLIDALPTKGQDYVGPYQDLVAAFRSAHLTLDFIHLDSQYETAQAGTSTSWAKIAQVEALVQDTLHLHFGLVATSRTAGYTSDKAFHDAVLDVPVEFQKAGGHTDAYVIMSWYPHPALTVPEWAGEDRYPAMRTVLDVHRELVG